MQERPANNIIGYNLEAAYIGPCTTLSQAQSTRLTGLSTMEYRFSGLISFGIYRLTVTAVSRRAQMASSTVVVQTLGAGKSCQTSSLLDIA